MMSEIGSDAQPLRVAIIGSGPSGFYAAEHLFKQKELSVQVDMFDRLPTPFGLVRGGVAPDHQKIKSVVKVYDRIAQKPNFRFFGYVEIGKDLSVEELKQFYHAIIFTTGAQTDKSLGVPGEDLAGSHAATEFVAWYNGHPDYRNLTFDLSAERAVVVGIGNVAMDVARILARTPEELAETDIADYALDALKDSKVKEIVLLGRRGPAQAAFTTPEIKEFGEMQDAEPYVLPNEAELDPISQAELEASTDRALHKKVEVIQSYAAEEKPNTKSRRLVIRFLMSPTAVLGEDGKVTGVELVKNELYKTESGTVRPRATPITETMDCGLIFRSIGYRGVPIEGVPFHDSWGVFHNVGGRIIDPDADGATMTGLYAAGWIKRGPSGVIGTNKPDSVETVEKLLEDLQRGALLAPDQPNPEAVQALVTERQPLFFSYDDWKALDKLETEQGEAQGRPRVKYTSVEAMIEAVKE